MPVVRIVRQIKISSANSRFNKGAIWLSNIGRNSRGGPGNITSHFGFRISDFGFPIFIANPGAVPN